MKTFKINIKRKSQQLIEFLLVVPFLVIILGTLTEYAYALNINMTLREGLRTVTSSIYNEIRPGVTMTQTDIKDLVRSNLIQYLKSNNIPVNTENQVLVEYVYPTPNATTTANQTSVFAATYTYIPAFTLPNIYFKILPKRFDFFATVAVPSAFLTVNNYDPNITSAVLDRIWSFSSDFSSSDGVNSSRDGIMRYNGTDSSILRGYVLFMVPYSAASAAIGGTAKAYAPIAWDGTVYHTSTGQNYAVDINTPKGSLYSCTTSGAVTCTAVANWTFLNFMKTTKPASSGYATTADSTVIFVNDTSLNDVSALTSANWLSGATATTSDISPDTVTGALKRAVALNNASNVSVGNYDNLNVNSYNSTFSSPTYTYRPYGSLAFVYPASIASIVTTNLIPTPLLYPDYDYDFN